MEGFQIEILFFLIFLDFSIDFHHTPLCTRRGRLPLLGRGSRGGGMAGTKNELSPPPDGVVLAVASFLGRGTPIQFLPTKMIVHQNDRLPAAGGNFIPTKMIGAK